MIFKLFTQSRLFLLNNKICVFLFLILLLGCASVPTQELDSYRSSFTAAKNAAEDVILSAKLAAKVIADHPNNPDSANDRVAKLGHRIQAADERLVSIETIDNYNTVLVQLAEGKDPKVIKSNLESFGNSLKQFGSSRLSGLVVKAIPYASIAAEIISLAEETANREEFVSLVKKGREPVSGIIDVLIDDADNIRKIKEHQFKMIRDPHKARIDDLKFKFEDVVNQYKVTNEITGIINRMNEVRGNLTYKKLSKVNHNSGSKAPTTSDHALLRLIVDTTAQEVVAANSITEKIKAYNAVIDEFKELLKSTKRSFVELERAIEINRPTATVDFIKRALALREAILKQRGGI